MIGSPARLFACLATAGLAALFALAGASPAHQVATLSGGQLTITGDQQNKLNDLVTIGYDSSSDELVIGNDVFGPHPAECSPDAVHPQRIIHCPASLISAIRIDTGTGSDKVMASVRPSDRMQVSLGAGNDNFTGGNEIDEVDAGSGSDAVYASGGADTVDTGAGSDKAILGAGNDVASMGGSSDKSFGGPGGVTIKGGPASDKLFGQGGPDKLFGGGAPDKLFGGVGNDQCNGGPGVGKEISC